ncbi:MAG: Abi family protein [Prevotellaceae bacterium]|nr:Abi family protein [Prevotellaceae bacterium]
MKQATTVTEQIAKLQSRGMVLDIEENKAKEILSDIGYFRLGFYCFPFETSYPNKKYRTHQYREGTKISDVIALYYFDTDLRNILTRYINRIEINFRTAIVYCVSNKYKNCSTWFVDSTVMEKSFVDSFDKRYYTDKFKKKTIIRDHHKKYINDKYAPAWKTLEFFTFGEILNIYRNLADTALKQEIADRYGIRNVKNLENYLYGVKEIRNLCAHGGVLFDHSLNIALIPGQPVGIDNQHKSKLFSIIQIMLFLLKSISINRANDLIADINSLFEDCRRNDIIYSLIVDSIGHQKIIA